MYRLTRLVAVVLFALTALPAAAYADNTACTGATLLIADGTTQQETFTAASQSRWYSFVAKPDRSYAVMAQIASPSDLGSVTFSSPAVDCANTGLPAGTTFTNSTVFEPPSWTTRGAGRWTLMTGSNSFTVLFKMDCAASAPGLVYNIRVEDTTLFSNWFFAGGDYSPFTLVRNTTSSTVNFTMNWRNSTGTIVATQTGTIAANGAYFKNGRDLAGVVSAVNGTVDIEHNGVPDALVASTTVLSATTGLSFDAPFSKRGGR